MFKRIMISAIIISLFIFPLAIAEDEEMINPQQGDEELWIGDVGDEELGVFIANPEDADASSGGGGLSAEEIEAARKAEELENMTLMCIVGLLLVCFLLFLYKKLRR